MKNSSFMAFLKGATPEPDFMDNMCVPEGNPKREMGYAQGTNTQHNTRRDTTHTHTEEQVDNEVGDEQGTSCSIFLLEELLATTDEIIGVIPRIVVEVVVAVVG